MSLIKKARREEAKLKFSLAGPSGSGKTYSALLFAKGFMGSLEKVVVVDTENGSAHLYDDLGEYSVLAFAPPYEPNRYMSAIDICIAEGFEFIILDSITPEWEGEGGCLDIHKVYTKSMRDSFRAWNEVTPLHNKFLEKIKSANAHILSTVRKKQDYVMEENNGKKKVTKVGLKDQTRDGFEYEVTLGFNLDMNHLAEISKDRTSMFYDGVPFMIGEDTGIKVREWNNGAKRENEQ